MTISPWAQSVSLASPSGSLVVTIDDAHEVGMGAPTCGELVVSNGMRRDACSPSLVWSDCSCYIAVPQWTTKRKQRLMVISVDRRTSRFVGDTFRVLELHSFCDGVIRGVDSPIHMPATFDYDANLIDWS